MKKLTIKEAKQELTIGEKIDYIYDYLNEVFFETPKMEVLNVLTARFGMEQGIIEFWAYYEGWSNASIDNIYNEILDQLEEDAENQDATINIE